MTRFRFAKTLALLTPLAAAAMLTPSTADACGGCFVPPAENTVVSGHRMALSISMSRTVLWDQIEYQGNPEDFTWVLPVKPGARIEEASPGWFEALDGVTATKVSAPPLQCAGSSSAFGCGSTQSFAASAEDNGGGGGEVEVIRQETVGPYDSVTLSSEDPDALSAWLESHGYDIPEDIQPTISQYVEEGFDFIALRLTPGNGVNLMSPVRVITEGASPVLPLRMVAAGTGPFTSIVLFVIGEGRWAAGNFPNAMIPYDQLVWDGGASSSNFSELRAQTLVGQGSTTWATTYAAKGPLLEYPEYQGGGAGGDWTDGYIVGPYFQTLEGEDGSGYQVTNSCLNKMYDVDLSKVVGEPCDPDTETCPPKDGSFIDPSLLDCEELTDLSTALVGMRPRDVWVTRMEANLARAALNKDLTLEAAAEQTGVANNWTTPNTVDYECPAAPVGSSSSRKGGPSTNGTALALVTLGALAAMLAARRRRGLLVRAV